MADRQERLALGGCACRGRDCRSMSGSFEAGGRERRGYARPTLVCCGREALWTKNDQHGQIRGHRASPRHRREQGFYWLTRGPVRLSELPQEGLCVGKGRETREICGPPENAILQRGRASCAMRSGAAPATFDSVANGAAPTRKLDRTVSGRFTDWREATPCVRPQLRQHVGSRKVFGPGRGCAFQTAVSQFSVNRAFLLSPCDVDQSTHEI